MTVKDVLNKMFAYEEVSIIMNNSLCVESGRADSIVNFLNKEVVTISCDYESILLYIE